MKKQIPLLIAILGILFTQTARAQTYKVKLANSPSNTIEFVLAGSPISIQGYSGNQVIITNTDYDNDQPYIRPKRAKGLHPIGGNGPGNTGIGLSVYKKNGILKVMQTLTLEGDYKVKVPNKVHIIIQGKALGSDIHINDYKGEIEIQAKTGEINLQNITGPVVAHSSFGNITVVFSHLSDAAPSSISTTTGYIDVTLPASTKADLKLSCSTGKIFTDFDIKVQNKRNGLMQIGGHEIKGTLNGGGVELNLRANFGNIYLRKK